MAVAARPRVEIIVRGQQVREQTSLMAVATDADGRQVPCRVRDISDSGVMLEFDEASEVTLGSKFEICVLSTRSRFNVKLVWRKDRQAGVLFCL